MQDGHLDLDESSDGKTMTGTWSGQIVPQQCGREIRGEWQDLEREAKSPFVLRRAGAKPAGDW